MSAEAEVNDRQAARASGARRVDCFRGDRSGARLVIPLWPPPVRRREGSSIEMSKVLYTSDYRAGLSDGDHSRSGRHSSKSVMTDTLYGGRLAKSASWYCGSPQKWSTTAEVERNGGRDGTPTMGALRETVFGVPFREDAWPNRFDHALRTCLKRKNIGGPNAQWGDGRNSKVTAS